MLQPQSKFHTQNASAPAIKTIKPYDLMAARVGLCIYNINNFPDDLLSHIISSLPMKEAVRTSVLSRRWRYLFTSMKNLDFEVHTFNEKKKLDGLLDFVDRLVLLQDMPSILRFRVGCFPPLMNPQRVERWICALVRNKIQELVLWSHCRAVNGLTLPESLFSCETLEVLNLDFRMQTDVLKFPATICLPRLKVLHLKHILFPNDGSEERLFPNCPVLEDLALFGCTFCKGCVKFSISNQNFKRLTLKFYFIKEKSVIFINAPSLVFLHYTMSGHHPLVLKDVKSLAEVVIDSLSALSSSVWPSRYDTYASGVLSCIQNIQTLKISYYTLMDLWRANVPIPLFEKMSCLAITWNWERYYNPDSLHYFLARCIVLETLVFEVTISRSKTEKSGIELYTLQNSQVGRLLRNLETFEIQVFDMVQIEEFMVVIEFFLGNAWFLKELKISNKGRPEQYMEIMEKITSLPRASKKCRVLFDALK